MVQVKPPFVLILSAPLLSLCCAMIFTAPVNADSCRLCSSSEEQEEKIDADKAIPIRIEITTNLNFSRAALSGRGNGQIAVNENSGQKRVIGQLVDLGGYAVAGSVLITGQPGRNIDIDMPAKITMRSNKGGTIEIHDLRTNLSPSPRLDLAGELRFTFGGSLMVSGDASGRFKGRIPITANYE